MLRSRTDLVYEHSARALTNAVDHERIFLMPLWKTVGKSRWLFNARNLPKTVVALAALVALTARPVHGPQGFRAQAKGTLQPVVKRDVFVPVDGDVIEVKVKDRDFVKEGDLLVKLRNTDLEVEYQDVHRSDPSQTQQLGVRAAVLVRAAEPIRPAGTRDEVERIRLSGEAEELEQEIATLGRTSTSC